MKIVLCGGHLTPALVIIDELEKHKEIKLVFFGRKYATEGIKAISQEYLQIHKKGIKFYEIDAGRLQRKLTRYTFLSLLKIPVGFIQSFIYLAKERPKLIISYGGYLSLPVIVCGWLLGIRSVAHEQASIPGIASKLNSLFVEKVYVSWPQTAKYFDRRKVEMIGNLTRQAIRNEKLKDQKIKKFLNSSKNLLFIMGGNQGSHFINNLIFKALPKLRNFSIIHQVGKTNWQGDLDQAKSIKSANYYPVDYIGPQDIGAVFKKASLVISRSGANTIWDLAVLSKPSILIPLPISGAGEQEANAEILKGAKMAQVISQEMVTVENLKGAISLFFEKRKEFEKHAKEFSKKLPGDSRDKFVKVILSYKFTK